MNKKLNLIEIVSVYHTWNFRSGEIMEVERAGGPGIDAYNKWLYWKFHIERRSDFGNIIIYNLPSRLINFNRCSSQFMKYRGLPNFKSLNNLLMRFCIHGKRHIVGPLYLSIRLSFPMFVFFSRWTDLNQLWRDRFIDHFSRFKVPLHRLVTSTAVSVAPGPRFNFLCSPYTFRLPISPWWKCYLLP